MISMAAPKIHRAQQVEDEEEEDKIMGQYVTTPTNATPTSPGVLGGRGVAISRSFSEENRKIATGVVRSNGGKLVTSSSADYLLAPLEGVELAQEREGPVKKEEGTPVTMIWLVSEI